ncbi:hypothetical protein AB0G04_34730 [Actinoplanes sp. NPDC023801]|uniref:hypothetical protein n=1 Tax=Actinoplanes sp. NPDC023801 TaxID=3154595 RepID=UPI00340578DE
MAGSGPAGPVATTTACPVPDLQLGGRLTAAPSADGGWTVEARLPAGAAPRPQ